MWKLCYAKCWSNQQIGYYFTWKKMTANPLCFPFYLLWTISVLTLKYSAYSYIVTFLCLLNSSCHQFSQLFSRLHRNYYLSLRCIITEVCSRVQAMHSSNIKLLVMYHVFSFQIDNKEFGPHFIFLFKIIVLMKMSMHYWHLGMNELWSNTTYFMLWKKPSMLQS